MNERSLPTPFGILNTNIKYIGKELTTLLMRQRRPAMLNNLSFNIWSLLRNFSITGFHVEIRDGLAPSGMPRYFLGRESDLQKIDVAKRKHKWSSTLIPIMELLWKFMWRPKIRANHLKILLTWTNWSISVGMNISMSSAYYRWLKQIPDANCSPLRMFPLDALWKRIERPSAAMSNRKGVIGSPWRYPRRIENYFEGDPLMRTKSFDEERHS
jgi:hypothetical protein